MGRSGGNVFGLERKRLVCEGVSVWATLVEWTGWADVSWYGLDRNLGEKECVWGVSDVLFYFGTMTRLKSILLSSIRVSSYDITQWDRDQITGNFKSSKNKKINCGEKKLFEINLKIR